MAGQKLKTRRRFVHFCSGEDPPPSPHLPYIENSSHVFFLLRILYTVYQIRTQKLVQYFVKIASSDVGGYPLPDSSHRTIAGVQIHSPCNPYGTEKMMSDESHCLNGWLTHPDCLAPCYSTLHNCRVVLDLTFGDCYSTYTRVEVYYVGLSCSARSQTVDSFIFKLCFAFM